MSAYESARYYDYLERVGNGSDLSPKEQRDFNTLIADKTKEEESEPRPWFYGGDFVDAF